MAHPKLVRLANQVRADLLEHFHGKPARQRDAFRWLFHALATAQAPEPLDALTRKRTIRGLQTHLRDLLTHLDIACGLPEALCSHYKYGRAERRARDAWRVRAGEWGYARDLAREVDISFDLFYAETDLSRLSWHDALEKDLVFVDVLIDPRALDDILVSVLEGALAPRAGRRKGCEVYGVCLGMTGERPTRRRGEGVTYRRIVHIQRAQPQITADADTRGVAWNRQGIDALLHATETLFPQYQAVGDFHSHPYANLGELDSRSGWEPSEEDEADNRAWMEHMRERHQRPHVGLIAAIAPSAKRVSRDHHRRRKNTLRFSVGGCRVVVGAHRILESGAYTADNIRLRMPGMP